MWSADCPRACRVAPRRGRSGQCQLQRRHRRGRMALSLDLCDGTAIVPTECLSGLETDLTFCECQLCQVYTQKTILEPSPPLENAVSVTHLAPSVASTHTLCLNHWTFFRIETRAPSAQQFWRDDDLPVPSAISAALGEDPSTPQGLVLTLDTTYVSSEDRFTSVDAFLHLSPTLPANWFQARRAAARACTCMRPSSPFLNAAAPLGAGAHARLPDHHLQGRLGVRRLGSTGFAHIHDGIR